MDIMETECRVVNWFQAVLGGSRWRNFVNTI